MKQTHFFQLLPLTILLTITLIVLSTGAFVGEAAPLGTPPVADFTIDPPQGVAGTLYFFDPISSSDNEDTDPLLSTRFDFDGDGNWDTLWDNPTNSPARHVYSTAGTYQVTLEVKDTDNMTDTKTVTLQVGDPGSNTAPTAACIGTPASGPPGTTFTFSASSSTDSQDATANLRVKWDQYGSFDFRGQTWSPATQPVTFTYNSLGIHEVDLLLIDSGQLTASADCQVEIVPLGGNTPPSADLTITPPSGNFATTFTYDVTGSSDNEDSIASLSVRFDWTDDGVYDTGWLNASQLWVNTYGTVFVAGQVTARAQIRDSGGLTDEATATINVAAPHQIFLPSILK